MPLRNTLVRLALSLAALILCPQPADAQQPPPSAWSVGGTVGFGYAGGEGASVMRLPWLLGGSLQRRIGDRPWWVGIEAIRLRARPTSAGMDTLRAGAPGDLTHAPGHLNDVQTGHYDTGIVEGLVRYDVPSQGVLAKYALAGLGLATTTGFLCNSSECAAGACRCIPSSRRSRDAVRRGAIGECQHAPRWDVRDAGVDRRVDLELALIDTVAQLTSAP